MNFLALAIPVGLLALLFRSKPSQAAELPSAGQPHSPASVPAAPGGALPPGTIVVPVAATDEQEAAAEVAAAAAQVRNWQLAVANAVASGDAAQLEQIARELEADKLTEQAKSVREVLGVVRAAALSATQTENPQVTAPVLAAVEPAPIQVAPDPRIAEAAKLIQYLKTTKKGAEDRKSVAASQQALGLSADGMYGINTALAVASFGIVPLPPWYLPVQNTAAAVAAFDDAMNRYAVSDPPRAREWLLVAELTSF